MPLAKSLPELIHHQKQVVDHFVEFFKHAPAKDMACGFTLVSVLGRLGSYHATTYII